MASGIVQLAVVANRSVATRSLLRSNQSGRRGAKEKAERHKGLSKEEGKSHNKSGITRLSVYGRKKEEISTPGVQSIQTKQSLVASDVAPLEGAQIQ